MWKMIERIGIVVGLILGIGALAQLIGSIVERTSSEKLKVIERDDEVVLSPDAPTRLVAGSIVVQGSVELPAGALVLTNHLSFRDDGALRGTNMAIIATRIDGGVIDASGHDGNSPGTSGDSGGSVLIAAGRIVGTTIQANGGRGIDGGPGRRGANGRNGNCAGFGGYKGADPGEQGGQGQQGGSGGAGGVVTVLTTHTFSPTPSATGGGGGTGGPGGPGGRGGAGCVGLGGTQPPQPPGAEGGEGAAGKPGAAGTTNIRTAIPFDRVIDELRAVGIEDDVPAAVSSADLFERLKLIAPGE